MLEVNGKTLEVGDTVVFRNGVEADIIRFYQQSCDNYVIIFKGNDHLSYYKDLRRYNYKDDLLDIVDIKKAPNPEIAEIITGYHVNIHGIVNIISAPCDFKIKEGYILGYTKTTIDKTNKKILSVEIVE